MRNHISSSSNYHLLDLDQQVAQISLNGVYKYEITWDPETHDIIIEPQGSRVRFWHPDTFTVKESISRLLGDNEFWIRGLVLRGGGGLDANTTLEEEQEVCTHTWSDYIRQGYVIQFNIVDKQYDDENAPPRAVGSEHDEHDEHDDEYMAGEFERWHREFRERTRLAWGLESDW